MEELIEKLKKYYPVYFNENTIDENYLVDSIIDAVDALISENPEIGNDLDEAEYQVDSLQGEVDSL